MPDRAIALAQRLIKKHGRSVTLAKFDPNTKTPWHEAELSSELTIVGVFVSPGASDLGIQISYEERTKLSAVMICSPGENSELDYNVVTDGTERLCIESIEYLRPGDKTILAYLKLSK